MDSAKLQETRRAAREWSEGFKVGEKVEVLITGTWQPAIVLSIKWVQQWPILRLKRPDLSLWWDWWVWYRERKAIRKFNEEKTDAN